jgi:NAD(P)-dependent dehydrogenase (short-subunit alcohol dehydrogenase family)
MEIDLRSLLTRDLGLHPQACRDRVVVVTGVGRGIDRQIARAFALLGGKVVLAELSTQGQEVEALAQEADRRRCG